MNVLDVCERTRCAGPAIGASLDWRTTTRPEPADGQILIEVAGCAVYRSNLHMIEGEWVDAGVPAISPIVDAPPLFCPSITAYGAVEKLAAGAGDTVAVFGLGAVGHMAIQFAALTGADVVAYGARDRCPGTPRRGKLRSCAVLENVRG